MKIQQWLSASLMMAGVVCSSQAELNLQLAGDAVQGGLMTGKLQPGSRVVYRNEEIRVAVDGTFLLGFGRDEEGPAVLKIICPDGQQYEETVSVAAREYDIQRIDGLPPKQVTPPPEVSARIRDDSRQVASARQRDDGRLDFKAGFIWPAEGPITGVYGSQRVLNGQPRRPHFGLDIGGPVGQPVFAPAAGVVTLAHPDMYYSGGTLIVDHGHSLSSTFLHLSKLEVAVGQRVEQGELIGRIGATGRATGPHLDWRMNWGKARIDPQLLVPARD